MPHADMTLGMYCAQPRVPLTRERVLRGALEFADAHGLASLTMRGLGEAFLQEFPAADHPYLVEHISYHIDSGVLGEGDLEFGLDLLLDSLERLRDLAATGS